MKYISYFILKKRVKTLKEWYSVDDIVEATGASKPTITRYVQMMLKGGEKLNRAQGHYNAMLYDPEAYQKIVDKLNITKEQRAKRAEHRAEKQHHVQNDVDMSEKVQQLISLVQKSSEMITDLNQQNAKLTTLLNEQSQTFYKSVDYSDQVRHMISGTDDSHRQTARKRRFSSL